MVSDDVIYIQTTFIINCMLPFNSTKLFIILFRLPYFTSIINNDDCVDAFLLVLYLALFTDIHSVVIVTRRTRQV